MQYYEDSNALATQRFFQLNLSHNGSECNLRWIKIENFPEGHAPKPS